MDGAVCLVVPHLMGYGEALARGAFLCVYRDPAPSVPIVLIELPTDRRHPGDFPIPVPLGGKLLTVDAHMNHGPPIVARSSLL